METLPNSTSQIPPLGATENHDYIKDCPPLKNNSTPPADSQESATSLPMIVYLSGDEEYADEFSLGAEEAMKALGIKRSRLTQISGRELRVGRIKDRAHIRPVFRPQDIEAYRQWTRPTASSQSASKTLENAQKKIEAQCESLSVTLERCVVAIEQQLKGHLLSKLQDSNRIQTNNTRKINSSVNDLATKITLFSKTLVENLRDIESKLNRIDTALTTCENSIGTVMAAHNNLNDDILMMRSFLTNIHDDLKRYEELFLINKKLLCNISKKERSSRDRLKNNFNALKEELGTINNHIMRLAQQPPSNTHRTSIRTSRKRRYRRHWVTRSVSS